MNRFGSGGAGLFEVPYWRPSLPTYHRLPFVRQVANLLIRKDTHSLARRMAHATH